MFKTWISNKDLKDRLIMPRIPACRFPNLTPQLPLTFKGNTAVANSSFALEYSVLNAGVKSRCFSRSPSPVGNVTFETQPEAQCAGVSAALQEVPATANATAGCTNGIYRYVAQAPATPGCYIMYIWLVDKQARGLSVLVKAQR
jgi:hypothetical protein